MALVGSSLHSPPLLFFCRPTSFPFGRWWFLSFLPVWASWPDSSRWPGCFHNFCWARYWVFLFFPYWVWSEVWQFQLGWINFGLLWAVDLLLMWLVLRLLLVVWWLSRWISLNSLWCDKVFLMLWRVWT